MACFFCKGSMKESTTTHVVNLKNCIIIVKNAPCSECEQCGVTAYSNEVALHLEKIVKATATAITEISVVNYSDKIVA
jgi:YgiT-type zinc finger domain-containing protein